MLNIPVLGRISLADYVRIFLAYGFIIVEPALRILFALLPLRWIVKIIFSYINPWLGPTQDESHHKETEISENIVNALSKLQHTEQFAQYWGYSLQTHYVTTTDGYILALHRLPFTRSESRQSNSIVQNKPVVLLWHGFMMCSEVWVCSTDINESLAFTLAEAGYDVWLGNTRGNKYSCKHRTLKPSDNQFWDFSIDQIAEIDFPASVNYILRQTGEASLSYIGFSQGSAQGFAGLSLNPSLAKKINLFIALAPSTKPKGLENQTIHSLVSASPEVIFLLFGRKAMLGQVTFWQNVLTPQTFSWIIDICMYGLFSWESHLMNSKHVLYRHLYSYTSVKVVVHWFQIIKNASFQMFDDAPTVLPGSNNSGHKIPTFPVNQIETPIAVFYGGRDTIPDIPFILNSVKNRVLSIEIHEYEHLQFLWGVGQDKVIFPAILGLLDEYSECWEDATEGNTIVSSSEPTLRTVPWITCKSITDVMHQATDANKHRATLSLSVEESLKKNK